MKTPEAHSETVLLFGGTFDPPHRAHTTLPLAAAESIGADRVVFIPANVNPQKTETPPTPVAHRIGMLEAALKGTTNTTISRIEVDHPGPSWTIDTLRRLVREPAFRDARLRLLIGADQALNFTTWKEWQQVEQMAEPVVMPRPPHSRNALSAEYQRLHPDRAGLWLARTLELPMLDDRSTDIRTLIAEGRSLNSLLAPEVEDYVREHRLYGWGDPPARINA
ncbi:MAG: nicotinate (nicotinamide) nucleotide adenylyltransferase [Planctomycetota bacterium]|nr:nicotinate (nicotinamide) nucleotide adenylyltransferase [Planctomycetota bacterium]